MRSWNGWQICQNVIRNILRDISKTKQNSRQRKRHHLESRSFVIQILYNIIIGTKQTIDTRANSMKRRSQQPEKSI